MSGSLRRSKSIPISAVQGFLPGEISSAGKQKLSPVRGAEIHRFPTQRSCTWTSGFAPERLCQPRLTCTLFFYSNFKGTNIQQVPMWILSCLIRRPTHELSLYCQDVFRGQNNKKAGRQEMETSIRRTEIIRSKAQRYKVKASLLIQVQVVP